MGVNPLPTGGIYKSFTFDGETSASFGVHLTGEGVYNAPERAVEMISIPARNGAFALDQGRFENIELEYTASIVADNETDFRTAISEFRNFLCSKTGYCRLEDDYNPNEYRMAVYKSGLEVDPFTLRTGEFSIVFDCKPQRYLTSGETAITVTSGNTITNPTRFEAQPQLEIEGYGNINFNGHNIELFDDLVGNVIVERQAQHYLPYSTWLGEIYVNANDVITLHPSGLANNINFTSRCQLYDGLTSYIDTYTKSNVQVSGTTVGNVAIDILEFGTSFYCGVSIQQVDFSALTEKTITVSWECTLVDTDSNTYKWYPKATIFYNGENSILYTFTGLDFPPTFYVIGNPSVGVSCEVQSTATTYGHPTYIDCETGEAYAIKNDVAMSLGKYVSLGSELPTLESGANTVTYDNTISSLKLTPRWWKV